MVYHIQLQKICKRGNVEHLSSKHNISLIDRCLLSFFRLKRLKSGNSPVFGTLAQLSDRNREFIGSVCLQELLQPHQPFVILVDDGKALPAPGFHQINVCLKHSSRLLARIANLERRSVVSLGNTLLCSR